MSTAGIDKLIDGDGTSAFTTNDRGVHRHGGTTKWNGAPVAIDIKIAIKYDVKDEYEPWSYELTLPLEQSFKTFTFEYGLPVTITNKLNGGKATFETPEEAETAAVNFAKHIAKQYKSYLEGKAKAKQYTLTLSLDSDDNKE